MKRYTLFELEKQAIDLGATYLRHHFIDVSYYVNPSRVEVFSTHFFNSEHNEVCMYIDSADLYELCGMTVFEKPRVWGECFINHKNTGKPIDIKTGYVKKFD